jgi:hypothetical protein
MFDISKLPTRLSRQHVAKTTPLQKHVSDTLFSPSTLVVSKRLNRKKRDHVYETKDAAGDLRSGQHRCSRPRPSQPTLAVAGVRPATGLGDCERVHRRNDRKEWQPPWVQRKCGRTPKRTVSTACCSGVWTGSRVRELSRRCNICDGSAIWESSSRATPSNTLIFGRFRRSNHWHSCSCCATGTDQNQRAHQGRTGACAQSWQEIGTPSARGLVPGIPCDDLAAQHRHGTDHHLKPPRLLRGRMVERLVERQFRSSSRLNTGAGGLKRRHASFQRRPTSSLKARYARPEPRHAADDIPVCARVIAAIARPFRGWFQR